VASSGKHLGRRVWWARWWAIGGAVALVGGVTAGALVAKGSSGRGSGSSPQHVTATKAKKATDQALALRAEQVQLAAAVTVSPSAGATAVGLDAAVTVSTSLGALRAVQVTNAAGAVVPGTLAPSQVSWRSGAWLQPTTAYRVVVTVARPDGVTAQRASTFTTVTPAALVTASVFPSDGMSVGVGQPIVFMFDHSVDTAAAQAAVLSHLSISMSKPVTGGWYWFSADELHFRPEVYWPAGEHITVTGDLDGWDATNGRWGSGQIDDSFSIGDARISVANLQTDQMTVTLNGATVGVYPISGGRTEYPTMDGDHIVLDRESVVHMVSSTVGIPVNSANGYDEYVYDDVHISDSGEYVHAAPWSVGEQGRTNVSHGCINVSPANALTFFNFSRVGDVVEVVGGPRPPAVGDHGVMDWSTPWSQWTPGAVHQLT
jgi:lipoprotein-anchoring transpeptidase ErfK/SrfK